MRLDLEELKKLMASREIKPKELAVASRITPSGISEILAGQVAVHIKTEERRLWKIVHGLRELGCDDESLRPLVINDQTPLFPDFEPTI